MARKVFIVVVASIISLVGVSVWAQRPVPMPLPPTPHPVFHLLTLPDDVRSGEDIGVRLIGTVNPDGTIKGAIVVKINGQWVDVIPAPVSAGR
jgi:hypothetical protein